MKQPTKDEFRWQHWKESSEFWQEQANRYKSEKSGKFLKPISLFGFGFVLGFFYNIWYR